MNRIGRGGGGDHWKGRIQASCAEKKEKKKNPLRLMIRRARERDRLGSVYFFFGKQRRSCREREREGERVCEPMKEEVNASY